MKSSKLTFKVQYSDTDAYKVVWHGSYLRWMEAGRVDWLYLNGIDIKKLDEEQNIVMPVVDLKIRYVKSAKLLEEVIVKTNVIEYTNLHVIFEQIITLKDGTLLTKAEVKGVGIQNGKIMKNLKSIIGE